MTDSEAGGDVPLPEDAHLESHAHDDVNLPVSVGVAGKEAMSTNALGDGKSSAGNTAIAKSPTTDQADQTCQSTVTLDGAENLSDSEGPAGILSDGKGNADDSAKIESATECATSKRPLHVKTSGTCVPDCSQCSYLNLFLPH